MLNKKFLQVIPYVLLIALSLLWGTSFFMTKQGLDMLKPDVLAALRIFLATLFFIPIALYYIKQTPFKKIPIFFLIGILGNVIPAFLFGLAQTHVSSNVSGIINSASPLSTFLLGLLFFRNVFSMKKLIGVFLGIVGVLILIFITGKGTYEAHFGYGLLIILATVLYAVASLLTGKHTVGVKPVVTAAWTIVPLGVCCLAYLSFFTDFFSLNFSSAEVQQSILAVSYLALVATGLGTFMFFILIKLRGPLFASSVTYLMPVVAVILGFFAHEPFHLFTAVGMIMILSAVYFINQR